jgi:hypothetical protein
MHGDLAAHAATRTNVEMAALIATETALRFRVSTVSDHRCALGLDSPRRNAWTGPLRRLREVRGHHCARMRRNRMRFHFIAFRPGKLCLLLGRRPRAGALLRLAGVDPTQNL